MAGPGYHDRSPHAEAVLAVRRVVARTAEVAAELIDASHTFADDLARRGMFDDSLDNIEFVVVLKEELRTDISAAIAELSVEITTLDFLQPRDTVGDFARCVVEKLVTHRVLTAELASTHKLPTNDAGCSIASKPIV